MLFGNKLLTELTESDLQKLIQDEKREDQNLEYKEQTYERNDEGIREMLRDITSIANAYGGMLIVGIREDKEGLPIEVVGVEHGEKEAIRIISSCLSNIEDRILGLDAWPVPLSAGQHVIVISIPQSLRAPHMITFKDLNQFWIRHGRQKSRMSVAEIRDKFLKAESLMEKLEDFLDFRKEKIKKRIGNYYKCWMVISATPVIVTDERIDVFNSQIKNLVQNPPFISKRGIGVYCGSPRPSLEGLIAEQLYNYQSTGKGQYLEIFRNGYLEFGLSLASWIESSQDRRVSFHVIASYVVTEYIVSFMYLTKSFFELVGILEPIVIRLAFYNASHRVLVIRNKITEEDAERMWKENDLEIRPMQVPIIDHPEKLAKILIDRLWNAFGYEKSNDFDDDGNFIQP